MDADLDWRHGDMSTAIEMSQPEPVPELLPARTLEALIYHVTEINRLLRHLRQTRTAVREGAVDLGDEQG
jgi:hypothetical protein